LRQGNVLAVAVELSSMHQPRRRTVLLRTVLLRTVLLNGEESTTVDTTRAFWPRMTRALLSTVLSRLEIIGDRIDIIDSRVDELASRISHIELLLQEVDTTASTIAEQMVAIVESEARIDRRIDAGHPVEITSHIDDGAG
jgi:hypothetical protein